LKNPPQILEFPFCVYLEKRLKLEQFHVGKRSLNSILAKDPSLMIPVR